MASTESFPSVPIHQWIFGHHRPSVTSATASAVAAAARVVVRIVPRSDANGPHRRRRKRAECQALGSFEGRGYSVKWQRANLLLLRDPSAEELSAGAPPHRRAGDEHFIFDCW